MKDSKNYLMQYIRDPYNGSKIGVVVATKDGLGFSICHLATQNCKGDKFDKKVGIGIALSRANHGCVELDKVCLPIIKHGPTIPNKYFWAVSDVLAKLRLRADRYFKVEPINTNIVS